MKKKLSMLLTAVLVCCLSLIVGTAPAMAADEKYETLPETIATSNELGVIEGVECVDGVKKDGESDVAMYRRIHRTPGEVYTRETFEFDGDHVDSKYSFLEEYIKMTYNKTWADYTRLENEEKQGGTFVTVSVRKGAKVSYFLDKRAKLEIESTPDIYAGQKNVEDKDITQDRDWYFFFVSYENIIKKGGQLLVRVTAGEETRDLKVVFNKPVKKKIKWKGKIKGKLVYPENSRYGQVDLTLNGSKVRFATGETYKVLDNFESYEIKREDVRSGIKLKFSTKDIVVGTGTATKNYYLVELDSDTHQIMHMSIGKEVKDTNARFRLGDYTSKTGKSRWTEHFVSVASYDKTNWTINSTIWDINMAMKVIKVRIPAQKKAPTVKINAVKGKVSISDKREYCVKADPFPDESTLDFETREDFYEKWIDGKKDFLISDIKDSSGSAIDLTKGVVLKVRTKGTTKKLPSLSRVIIIPAQQTLDPSKVTVEGVVTKCSIKISDANGTKNPYEYTTETPTADTRWKKITTTTKKLSKSAVNGTEPVIYVRQRAVNEDTRKKISLRVASTIVAFTYDPSTGKWTGKAWSPEKPSTPPAESTEAAVPAESTEDAVPAESASF